MSEVIKETQTYNQLLVVLTHTNEEEKTVKWDIYLISFISVFSTYSMAKEVWLTSQIINTFIKYGW